MLCEPEGWACGPNDEFWGKFFKSFIKVPIAAVAGSNDQSALPLVGQVGASRDLSEATRRGAVRALWGTVTHTGAGPFSFSNTLRLIDLSALASRAQILARHRSISFSDRSVITGTDSPRGTSTTLRRSRAGKLLGEIVPKISDNSQGACRISGVAALSVRSARNAPVAFQESRVRRYGSAVGPHWSLLKTFFSAIEQLHTSAFSVAEDYYRRHGSRRIGPHRSILKCRLRNCVS